MLKGQILVAGQAGTWPLNVRICQSLVETQNGLQGSSPLTDSEGMVFPFDQVRPARFHMGTVQFPIDIIWIRDGRVVRIITAQPGVKDHWETIAGAVLEVRGGWCKDHDVVQGDQIMSSDQQIPGIPQRTAHCACQGKLLFDPRRNASACVRCGQLEMEAAGAICKRCQVKHRKPENCPFYGKEERQPGAAEAPVDPKQRITEALQNVFGEKAQAIGNVLAPELMYGIDRSDMAEFLADEAGLSPQQSDTAIKSLESMGVIKNGPSGYQMVQAPVAAKTPQPAAPAPLPPAPVPAQAQAPAQPPAAYQGALAANPQEIDAVLQQHGQALDKVMVGMQKTLKAYEQSYIKPRPGMMIKQQNDLADAWKTKSPGEKLLHAAGHEIGVYFESTLTPEEKAIHEQYMDGWQASSKSQESQHLHGLASSLGVPGSPTPQEQNDPEIAQQREQGKKNAALQAYVKKSYLFTQAAMKKLGLTELTGYRGVSGMIDGIPPQQGDAVNCKTREMSSFSTDPSKARVFGRRIEYKIPASQVFASSLTRPQYGSSREAGSIGEAEIVVLGSSTSSGKVTSGPRT